MLKTVGDYGIGALFVLFVLFTLLFSLTPWYRTELGKQMFMRDVVFTIILLVALVNLITGHSIPGQGWVRAILFPLAAVTILWQLIIFIRKQYIRRCIAFRKDKQ